MDNLKLLDKAGEELQKQMQTETSVMISIGNSDLTSAQRWYLRKEE
jgi:hypothetical protein